MQSGIPAIILLLSVLPLFLSGQQPGTVTRLPFCSNLENEFSPVYYKDGLIFCSDGRDNSPVGFTNGGNRVYKIYCVQTRKGKWDKPELLAGELVSGMHDGPAFFCAADSQLYFSRNNNTTRALRNITDTTNKLGIYMTHRVGGTWSPARSFRYNENGYTLTTPTVSKDGGRMYFASDKPGGFGGLDLYYSDKVNGEWNPPVNLGPHVNTALNEDFPFAAAHGRLYFSSDGHPGLGGKDLYYSTEIDGQWISPIHLDSVLNSTADDFGLVTDYAYQNGFFSSNRRKTDDIYSYTAPLPVFTDCDTMVPNRYCYTFYDERQPPADTMPVEYRWDFGDERIRTGIEAGYCFPGPGTYLVKLRIVNTMTGKDVANEVEYVVNLDEIQQGRIHSPDLVTAGHSVAFDGLQSKMGEAKVTQYYWDFGEGFAPGGAEMDTVFERNGNHVVQLGLALASEGGSALQYVCVKKTIRVLNREPEVLVSQESGNSFSGDGYNGPGAACFPVMLLAADGLSDSQRQSLMQALNLPEVKGIEFRGYAITPASKPVFTSLAAWLKSFPDLRMDIMVQSAEALSESMPASDRYAQAIDFTLKEFGVNSNTIQSNGFELGVISALLGNKGIFLRDAIVLVLSKPSFQ